MDPVTQQGCTPHSTDVEDMLQALRREMEGRMQGLHRELARLRQKVRHLERAVEGRAAASGLVASGLFAFSEESARGLADLGAVGVRDSHCFRAPGPAAADAPQFNPAGPPDEEGNGHA